MKHEVLDFSGATKGNLKMEGRTVNKKKGRKEGRKQKLGFINGVGGRNVVKN